MKKITFYVPESHKENVKNALFSIGAGQQGNYIKCCFEIEGVGQFMPLANSTPFIGEKSNLCHVKEFRVELLCADELLRPAVTALLKAHPYESPAFDITSVLCPLDIL